MNKDITFKLVNNLLTLEILSTLLYNYYTVILEQTGK